MRPCEEKATEGPDMGVVRPVMAMNESSIGRSTQYDSLCRTDKGWGGALSSSSNCATVGAPVNASAAGPHAARGDAVVVHLPPDVLGHILGFIITSTTGRATMKVLNQLSPVCRAWRAALSADCWWSAVADDVVPALWLARRGEGLDARTVIVEHGRCMWAAERQPWVGPAWTAGLSIHFEAFDVRDGRQLLSVQGPLYHSGPGHLDDGGFEVTSRLFVTLGSECGEAAAFSARGVEDISRASYKQHFGTRRFWSAFTRPWASEGVTCDHSWPWIQVRVWVDEAASGRRAMLCEDTGGMSFESGRGCHLFTSSSSHGVLSRSCPDAVFRAAVQLHILLHPKQDTVSRGTDVLWYVCPGGKHDAPRRLDSPPLAPVLLLERVGEFSEEFWSPGETYVARLVRSLLAD